MPHLVLVLVALFTSLAIATAAEARRHPDRNPQAQSSGNWFGPGQYDRIENGSDASTPGHN